MEELPESKAKFKPNSAELQFELPLDQVVQWASSKRIAGRVCESRFRLGAQGLAALQEFLMRFREEQALNGIAGPVPDEEAVPTPNTAI